MKRTRRICGLMVFGVAFACVGTVYGQAGARRNGNAGPGSTIEGDVLRGEGAFLRGMGWYELRSAKARANDAKTQLQWEKWNKDLLDQYQSDLTDHAAQKLAVRNGRDENARRALVEHERRLRENPSLDDIRSGDALNALLIDLCSPKVLLSGSHSETVPLPQDFALRSVAYRFAGAQGGSKADSLSRSVLDLQRLKAPESWPIFLRMAALKPRREAYERAIRAVIDECKAGCLSLDSVLALDRAIAELKKSAGTTVPTEDGMRVKATRFVDDLDKATKLFKTLDLRRSSSATSNSTRRGPSKSFWPS